MSITTSFSDIQSLLRKVGESSVEISMKDPDKMLAESYRILDQISQKQIWAELTVSITATLNECLQRMDDTEVVLRLPKGTLRNLKDLALISYFVSDELRSLLQFELSKRVQKRPELQMVEVILTSKAYMDLYLLSVLNEKGTCGLFGSELQEDRFLELAKKLRIVKKRPKSSKIRETRRIGVGYKDKGQLPDYAKGGWLKNQQLSKDYILEQEFQMKSAEDTLELLRGILM